MTMTWGDSSYSVPCVQHRYDLAHLVRHEYFRFDGGMFYPAKGDGDITPTIPLIWRSSPTTLSRGTVSRAADSSNFGMVRLFFIGATLVLAITRDMEMVVSL